MSDQSESLHFFAKRRLPLQAIWESLLGSASLREIARRYHLTPPAVQNAILRLGRQAMSAHLHLLNALEPRDSIVYDGLRSFIASHDYPCDITTVVDPEGEVILTMWHTVFSRRRTREPKQKRPATRRRSRWKPIRGTMRRDIALLHREIWDYLRPGENSAACIRTDELPLYHSRLSDDPVARHLSRSGLLVHQRTSSRAPRGIDNPLFPVNYVDRLLRHRLKEHVRDTIAFGRQSTLQMHRAWIFAYDHNCRREYRVKHPELGPHTAQGAVPISVIRDLTREFFVRRIRLCAQPLPETIRRVWLGELPSPPVRWKSGQQARAARVPFYALRDLSDTDHHAP